MNRNHLLQAAEEVAEDNGDVERRPVTPASSVSSVSGDAPRPAKRKRPTDNNVAEVLGQASNALNSMVGRINDRSETATTIMFKSLAAQFELLPQRLQPETMFKLQQVIYRANIEAMNTGPPLFGEQQPLGAPVVGAHADMPGPLGFGGHAPGFRGPAPGLRGPAPGLRGPPPAAQTQYQIPDGDTMPHHMHEPTFTQL